MIDHKRMSGQPNRRVAKQLILAAVSLICALPIAVVSYVVLDGSATSAAPANCAVKNERVLIAIEGMHCTSCANGIKAMLKRTPGVIAADVSYDRREADVEYDSSRISPEKILEAISNMGYKANVKEQGGS